MYFEPDSKNQSLMASIVSLRGDPKTGLLEPSPLEEGCIVKRIEHPKFEKCFRVETIQGDRQYLKVQFKSDKTEAQKLRNRFRKRSANGGIRHRFLVNELDFAIERVQKLCFDEWYANLYYELPETDLLRLCKKRRSKLGEGSLLKSGELKMILKQQSIALSHLHAAGKYHGSLKPADIGFTRTGQTKLWATSVVSKFEDYKTKQKNLLLNRVQHYLSPNVYNSLKKNTMRFETEPEKEDAFALGLILLEAGTGRESADLYRRKGGFDVEGLERMWEEFESYHRGNEDLIDKIKHLTRINRSNRATIQELGFVDRDSLPPRTSDARSPHLKTQTRLSREDMHRYPSISPMPSAGRFHDNLANRPKPFRKKMAPSDSKTDAGKKSNIKLYSRKEFAKNSNSRNGSFNEFREKRLSKPKRDITPDRNQYTWYNYNKSGTSYSKLPNQSQSSARNLPSMSSGVLHGSGRNINSSRPQPKSRGSSHPGKINKQSNQFSYQDQQSKESNVVKEQEFRVNRFETLGSPDPVVEGESKPGLTKKFTYTDNSRNKPYKQSPKVQSPYVQSPYAQSPYAQSPRRVASNTDNQVQTSRHSNNPSNGLTPASKGKYTYNIKQAPKQNQHLNKDISSRPIEDTSAVINTFRTDNPGQDRGSNSVPKRTNYHNDKYAKTPRLKTNVTHTKFWDRNTREGIPGRPLQTVQPTKTRTRRPRPMIVSLIRGTSRGPRVRLLTKSTHMVPSHWKELISIKACRRPSLRISFRINRTTLIRNRASTSRLSTPRTISKSERTTKRYG